LFSPISSEIDEEVTGFLVGRRGVTGPVNRHHLHESAPERRVIVLVGAMEGWGIAPCSVELGKRALP